MTKIIEKPYAKLSFFDKRRAFGAYDPIFDRIVIPTDCLVIYKSNGASLEQIKQALLNHQLQNAKDRRWILASALVIGLVLVASFTWLFASGNTWALGIAFVDLVGLNVLMFVFEKRGDKAQGMKLEVQDLHLLKPLLIVACILFLALVGLVLFWIAIGGR